MPRSKLQAPVLTDEIVAKAAVRLLLDEAEADALVNAASGDQDVVRPQDDRGVAAVAREADAFLDKAAPHAEPARFGLDVQHSKLGRGLVLPDDEHGADDLAIDLGDPTALAGSVELRDELCHDLRDERLESPIPAVLLRVKGSLPVDDVAHISRAVIAQ